MNKKVDSKEFMEFLKAHPKAKRKCNDEGAPILYWVEDEKIICQVVCYYSTGEYIYSIEEEPLIP